MIATSYKVGLTREGPTSRVSDLASNSEETWRAIGGGREQHCIRFDRSDIETQISDFESSIVTATPISRLPIRHVDVRILANSRGYSSMSNFTFCILYKKILVFACTPSIVSCISYLVKQIWTCC